MYYQEPEFHFKAQPGIADEITAQDSGFLAAKHSRSYGATQKTASLPIISAASQGRL